MKKGVILFLLLFNFFYLYSQTQSYTSAVNNYSVYKYSDDPEKSEIIPIRFKEDTVLVRSKNPYFSLDSLNLYNWDLIKSKKFVERVKPILKDTMEYDGWMMLLYYKTQSKHEFSLKEKFPDERFKKVAPYGFVSSSGFKENSIGEVQPFFQYTNLNDKTIKYITFYVQYRNAVGDLIKCRLTGSQMIPYTGVGPVEEGQTGSWSWDYDLDHIIFYPDKMEIKKIVIEYMDGSKHTLTNDIKYGEIKKG